MLNKFLAIILSLSIFLTGCASTTANPVPIAQVGDETKTCDAIANEMQKMVTAKIQAEGDKNTQIGTNAALAITGIFLIVPWFFMDLGGAATAEQKAAQARYERLQQMQIDKKCPATPIVSQEQVEGGENIIRTTTPIDTSKPAPARSSIMPGAAPLQNNNSNPAKKLEDLNIMLKKGLITQDEYNSKKAEILKSF
jgi:PBP1b-binding outer membrane lipoprotein LpoB